MHNKHNDSDFGCHNSKIDTGQTLGPKESETKTQKKIKTVELPSSDSSQLELGEIFIPDASVSEGNDSDAYDPKDDLDDEES